MFEREWFALTCIAALAGVVSSAGMIGCSSSDTNNNVATTGSDAGGDSGNKGTVPSSGDDSCTSKTPFDLSGVAFKPPRVIPGSCSDADRESFRDIVASTSTLAQTEQLMKARNPACAACIFGTDGDTWAPLVEMANGEYTENVGGCFAVVSGKVACGKAYQQLTQCMTAACSTCSKDESEACGQEARDEGGICEAAYNDYILGCGPDPAAVARRCIIGVYVVEGSIQRQCGSETTDGGT
jgi:hypothetical protein